MISLSSSAMKYMKLIMCSGVPLKFFRNSGFALQYLLGRYLNDKHIHDTTKQLVLLQNQILHQVRQQWQHHGLF
jgi:hypothetical protein